MSSASIKINSDIAEGVRHHKQIPGSSDSDDK